MSFTVHIMKFRFLHKYPLDTLENSQQFVLPSYFAHVSHYIALSKTMAIFNVYKLFVFSVNTLLNDQRKREKRLYLGQTMYYQLQAFYIYKSRSGIIVINCCQVKKIFILAYALFWRTRSHLLLLYIFLLLLLNSHIMLFHISKHQSKIRFHKGIECVLQVGVLDLFLFRQRIGRVLPIQKEESWPTPTEVCCFPRGIARRWNMGVGK